MPTILHMSAHSAISYEALMGDNKAKQTETKKAEPKNPQPSKKDESNK